MSYSREEQYTSKVWEWITSKERTLEKYEEAKKEFSKVLGKPVIMIPVELPDNLLHLREEFCALEKDAAFIKKVQKSSIQYLKKKHAPEDPKQNDTS